LTRNVGITLTDIAYHVWREIPHGQRSKIVNDFLIKNAENLVNLKKTTTPELTIAKALVSGEQAEEEEESTFRH